MAKTFENDAPAILEFRKNVIKELVNEETSRLSERSSEPAAPIPQFRFNRETSTTQLLVTICWPAKFMYSALTHSIVVKFVGSLCVLFSKVPHNH